MPRGTNQKFKFLYLMEIMQQLTDDEHGLTLNRIMDELEKYGVTAERKSLYTDFQDMTDNFGVEIIKCKSGRETYYHVGERKFELAEVKLLIDAIQSSKFITEKKSRELIGKIKSFVSIHQANQLQRQIFITDRVKTMNESVYYNVDEIHTAINENKKILFKYYQWGLDKKMAPRHDGNFLTVSPWALIWDNENYYMVAYDDRDEKIKHYRVDKMGSIKMSEERRAGRDLFEGFDMAGYSKATFGMYGGRKEKVRIRFENSMCGIFVDRFGKDISFIKVDDHHSEFNVDVNISPQFFGWLISLGPQVSLVGPEDVKKELMDFLKKAIESQGQQK